MDPVYVLQLFLRAVAAPAAVALAAALVARAAGRRPRVADVAAAVGLAGGALLGLWLFDVRPGLVLAPSEDAWQWVVLVLRVGLVLGVVAAFVRGGFVAHVVALDLLGGLATALVIGRIAPQLTPGEVAARAAVGGVAAAALGAALWANERRGGRFLGATPAVVALAAAAFAILEGGRSLVMAMATAALGAATAATAACGAVRGGAALPRSAVVPLVLAFVALLSGAHGYLSYGDVVRFPLTSAVLLVASAACVAIPCPRWALALSVLLALGALALAIRWDEPLTYGG